MRRADSVEISEGAELQLGDLRDGLDDEVHRSTCSDVRRGGDPTVRTISIRLAHPFLGDELVEAPFDGIHASIHIGLFEIDHDHIEPCDCGDLGDAVPHLSGTEDGNALRVHGRLEGVEPMNLRVGSLVVLAGLEPASSEPKSEMIDRYTTGLA